MNARARHITPEVSEPVAETTFAAVYRMSKSQLIVGWSVVGAMLVVVFLFGFYSGRRQGVELALTEQSVPRLRLPVESPKARAALSAPTAVTESNLSPVNTKFDFTETKPDSFAVESSDKSVTETVVLEPKQTTNDDISAGFVAKAANEISVKPVEVKKEIDSNTEAVDQSLAERVAKVELSPSLKSPSTGVTNTATIEDSSVKVAKVEATVDSIGKGSLAKSPAAVNSKGISNEGKLTAPVKKVVTLPSKPAQVATSGLFVQVGAPDSFAKAQSMVSRLRAKGLTAAVRDASVNNKMHYRVLVGPYSSRESAENAKKQVAKSGVALGEPFIKNY